MYAVFAVARAVHCVGFALTNINDLGGAFAICSETTKHKPTASLRVQKMKLHKTDTHTHGHTSLYIIQCAGNSYFLYDSTETRVKTIINIKIIKRHITIY